MWYHGGVTAVEKLRRHIENNPRAVTFEDLDHLLRACGFAHRPGKGSHHFYWCGEHRLTIPYRRPHVLEIYVKKALAVIDQAEREHDHD
jgi:predicted RNA binding protein YcfA (HicA-like mRNA interferase family)